MFALFFRKPFLLLLQQKKAPQGFYINLIFRNAAGELAPMRFRRLPGVTGPCPSTTLDKSFIHFLSYFIGKMDVCQ